MTLGRTPRQADLFRSTVGFCGVISPLLLNVALHGMEAAAGVRYYQTGTRAGKVVSGCPTLVRYADDLVALCHTREQAEQVKARLADWLAPRGLVFNEDKTQITHLEKGVDFLGFTIRRYPNGKLLTKPSNAALRRIRRRLSCEVKAMRGANAEAVIARLNPIITGWAAYYWIGVSKRAFNALDAHVWRLVYKWAVLTHSNKPRRWVNSRYFGMFNPARRDKWVFGSRDRGFYLRKFAWTPIIRHRMWPRRRLRTIRRWPTTGTGGVAASRPRWAPPRCSSSEPSAAAARYAGGCCCTPTATLNPRASGSNRSRSPARRSAHTRSSFGVPAHRMNASLPASYTPTAARTCGGHWVRTSKPPMSLQGLLEPIARRRAWPVLRRN